MDQPSSAALIVSIVAVVFGALGLVGGVIGYVQGTAALRRATLTRQRASAAEEAALGARAQAEQSARIAQDALDRISRLQLRSLGDVADQPTGPLLLPPRAVLAPPMASASEPVAIEPAPEPLAIGASAEQPDEQPMTAEQPETAEQPGQAATGPIEVQTDQATTAEPEAAITGPTSTQAEPPADTPAPATDSVLAQEEASPVTGPVVVQGAAHDVPRAPRHATGPIPIGTASAGARGPIPAPLDEAPEHEPEADPQPDPVHGEAPPDGPETVQGDQESIAEETPARSATGQVTAGAQEAPPMDWAEVLRTGAIPLPTMSRGTYAAPTKSRKTPTGPARFDIRAVGRQSFEVVNVGAEEAQLASVEGAGEDRHLVRPLQTRRVAVPSGGSLAFSLLRVEGRQVSVEVTWQRDGQDQSAELAVP